MFDSLFRPGRIGSMDVKNRLVKPAQHMGTADEKGFVTPLQLKLYSRWAQGGTALIIVEMAAIDFKGSLESPNQIVAASDEYIPGLAQLAQIIKETGARAALQISHGGGIKFYDPPGYAPSAMPYEFHGIVQDARELTIAEIEEIIEAYGQAAGRAKRAGFDMVEIHMAHGYLPAQFVSPRTNLRTDRYGGGFENRLRFPLEVLGRVRSHVGNDFPISCRISGTEYEENGITLVESIQFARALERASVDVLNVSAGGSSNHYKILIQTYLPRAFNVYCAEAIKKSGGIEVPVICNGGITTPELAEEILAAGKADFVGIGRPLWADPDWPRKAQEGRSREIRPCIRGGFCVGNVSLIHGMDCSVNPELVKEYEQTLEPVARPRNVAVIGGGPGGLEAARVAATKGHKVTVYEKREVLGGNAVEDSVPQFRSERRGLLAWFENELRRLGVTVKHEEATADTIEKGGFDAVIAATGSRRTMPKVRGADKPFVIDMVEALQGKMKGESVVVVATDYETRCVDVALYAAEQDKKATLLFTQQTREQLMEDMAGEEGVQNMQSIMEVLHQKPNIEVRLGTKLLEVTGQGVVVQKEGKEQSFGADTVVLVPDFAPYDDLARALERRGFEVHKIGDCMEPMRYFRDAIHEGHLAARRL
jgi:2,4-dienoyl-CoA reductase-like NADH-dependent reductase (Old Yellow Enzyme family)/thioredoxin reductase